MHINQNTIMRVFLNRAMAFYRFSARGSLVSIANASLICQECNGIFIWLWNVLYGCFQFPNFWQKMQSGSLVWGAASESFALGLQCAHICQWIRVENWPRIHVFSDFEFVIFHNLFQSFLPWKLAYFGRFGSLEHMHEISIIYGRYLLHKRILKTLI